MFVNTLTLELLMSRPSKFMEVKAAVASLIIDVLLKRPARAFREVNVLLSTVMLLVPPVAIAAPFPSSCA